MRKATLAALTAAPFLAAGAGVVAAKVIPFWPFRLLEEGYRTNEAATSCVAVDMEATSVAPSFTKEVDGVLDPWRLDVYSETAPDCVSFDVFNLLGRAQCDLDAPARVVYRSEEMGERAFEIQTIGAHRVRASRHGLSCRPLLDDARSDAKPLHTFAERALMN